MKRRSFLKATAATAATAGTVGAIPAYAQANATPAGFVSSGVIVGQRSVLLEWNSALLDAIRTTSTPPTIAARAISMVHEAAYNAWACYDARAGFTLPGMVKRPSQDHHEPWKAIAVSHAVRPVLENLFPTYRGSLEGPFAALNHALGFPQGLAASSVGQHAAALLLARRHADGSNQLGNLAHGAYSDWTGYAPVNTPDALVDPLRWQPLRTVGADGVAREQRYLTPHWGRVQPFALAHGAALRPRMDRREPSAGEVVELLQLSATLDDRNKATAEFWAAGPGTVTPPGMWVELGEHVSQRDGNGLDNDVKLFFVIGQALLDASIVAWDAKRAYDSVRPISAIRHIYAGRAVRAWAGPGLGAQWIQGELWRPYIATPPFAEFVSGHSTFSAAAASVLEALRGAWLPVQATLTPGSSLVEPGHSPTAPVTLRWNSVWELAHSAGYSRRLGGIHFVQGDLVGRQLGAAVGRAVTARCRRLFAGLA